MCWPKNWKCCVGPSSFSLQNTDFLFSSVRNWPFQLDVWQVHMTSVLDAVLWFVIVQVNVSWMCLHLKYSDNTWCRTAKASFFSFFLFFFLLCTISETALGVEEHHSLAVWVGGDMGQCRASQMEHVVWDTTSPHYIMDKKGNDRTTSAGKSLMQGNILYNATNIDGICPQWAKIAKRAKRQNSSSSVQGKDSNYTINTLTDNTGHEQFSLLAFKISVDVFSD